MSVNVCVCAIVSSLTCSVLSHAKLLPRTGLTHRTVLTGMVNPVCTFACCSAFVAFVGDGLITRLIFDCVCSLTVCDRRCCLGMEMTMTRQSFLPQARV